VEKLHEQTEHDKRLALASERLPAPHYKGMRIAHETSPQYQQLGSNIVKKSKYHPQAGNPMSQNAHSMQATGVVLHDSSEWTCSGSSNMPAVDAHKVSFVAKTTHLS
jgi:hypothetical protein